MLIRRIKNLSIAVNAAIALALFATLVLGTFGVIDYALEKKSLWAGLHERITNEAEELSVGLTVPVWNIDRTQIERLLESAMKDPNIYQIWINAADHIHVRRRDAHGQISVTAEKPPDSDFIEEGRPIVHGNEVIGSVIVTGTSQIFHETLKKSRERYVLLVVLIDLVLVVSLYLILWKTVIKPLREVERYAVAVSSTPANKDFLRGQIFYAEIETLRAAIEKMVGLLELRIQEVKDSEWRYRTLFSAEPDSIVILDQKSKKILDVNEAALAMYGYTHQEMVQLTAPELSTEANRVIERVDALVPGGVAQYGRRMHLRKDGTAFPVDISARAFIMGGAVTLVAAIRDVSEAVRSETALYAAKERAESADRIKSEFLDIAAHELKTPLTPLTVLLQLSRRQSENGIPIAPEIWDRMSFQVERLTGLVRDLLDVSRLEHGTFPVKTEKFDLNQLVTRCIQDFSDQQHDGRRIVLERSSLPIEVEADPARIYEVVANLVDNALKYTAAEKSVEAKIVTLSEGRVRVSVTDHGKGIPSDQRQALFTRFFRLTSDETIKHSGLGLGLYICRRILELHKGNIGVESEVGKGSTFFFELPRKVAS